MTIFVDDFKGKVSPVHATYGNVNAIPDWTWNNVDNSEIPTYQWATVDADPLAMNGASLRITDVGWGSLGSISPNVFAGLAANTPVEMLYRFYINSPVSISNFFGLNFVGALRCDDAVNRLNAIMFRENAGICEHRLYEFQSGAAWFDIGPLSNRIGLERVNVSNKFWWHRLRVDQNDKWQWKSWQQGETEPEWFIVPTVESTQNYGAPAFAITGGTHLPWRVDYVSIGSNGDIAPTPNQVKFVGIKSKKYFLPSLSLLSKPNVPYTFSDDFSGNELGFSTPINWTYRSSGNWRIQIKEGVFGHKAMLFDNNGSGASDTWAYPTDIGELDNSSSIEILLRTRIVEGTTGNTWRVASIFKSPLDRTGYTLDFDFQSQQLEIVRIGTSGSAASTLSSVSTPVRLERSAAAWYWARFRREQNGTFRAKIWLDKDKEPAAWLCTGTSTNHLRGYCGLSTSPSSVSCMQEVDYFSIGVGQSAIAPSHGMDDRGTYVKNFKSYKTSKYSASFQKASSTQNFRVRGDFDLIHSRTEVSLMVWLKWNSDPGVSPTDFRFLSWATGTSESDHNFLLGYNSATNTLRARFARYATTALGLTNLPNYYSSNSGWVLVGASYNGNAYSKVKLWLNGVNDSAAENTVWATSIPKFSADFCIGNQPLTFNSSPHAKLAHAAVFNKELTSTEWLELYRGRNPQTIGQLNGYWPLDDSFGRDLSGCNFHARPDWGATPILRAVDSPNVEPYKDVSKRIFYSIPLPAPLAASATEKPIRIRRRTPVTKQPQGTATVRGVYTAPIIFATLGSDAVDLVQHFPPKATGTVTGVSTPYGMAREFSSDVMEMLQWGNSDEACYRSSNAVTIMTVMSGREATTWSAYSPFIRYGNDTSWQPNNYMMQTRSGSYEIQLVWGNSIESNCWVDFTVPTSLANDKKQHVLIGRMKFNTGSTTPHTDKDMQLWVDGVEANWSAFAGTNDNTVPVITSGGYRMRSGAQTTSTNSSGFQIFTTVVFRGALSDEEIASLSKNPWQVFVPQLSQYIMVPVEAVPLLTSWSGITNAHRAILVR